MVQKIIKSLPNNVKFFLLTELVMGLGMGIWNLNLNYFLVDRGLAPAAIGILGALGSLAIAVFSILAGGLTNRKGYYWIMLSGCLLKTAGMVLTLITPSFAMLAAARVVNGLGDALAATCAYPYIISLVEDRHKNIVYSMLFSTSLFAMFGGSLAGGYLFALFGWGNLHLSTLLVGSALIGLAAVGRGFLPKTAVRGEKRNFKVFVPKERFLMVYFIYTFMGYGEYFMAGSMVNLICRDIVGIPESAIGLVLGLSVLVASVSTMLAPFLTERFGRPRVSVFALTVLMGAFALMARVGGVWFCGLNILTMLLNNMMVGVIDAPMLKRIPDSEQAAFSGVKILVSSLATAAGTAAAGFFVGMPHARDLIYGLASLLMLGQVGLYYWGFRNELEEGDAAPEGEIAMAEMG